MSHTPYLRVEAILDGKSWDIPTPKTLTGSPTSIWSYNLEIAHKVGGEDAWIVYNRKNSATTNRHIRAVQFVLEQRGYHPTDTDTWAGRRYERRPS